MKKIFSLILIMSGGIWFARTANAQQQITVNVHPTVSKSIKGHKEFNRGKYINLATNSPEITRNVNSTRFETFFDELEMSMGRKFQLIRAETNWGDGFREDATRPGFMDTTFFKNRTQPNDNGMDDLKAVFGGNVGVAAHDGHKAYPSFMEKYQIEGGENDEFPSNNDAAAEMIAFYLKYAFTDFQRPATFEPVNEPHWRYWSDPRFIKFHTKAKQKVDEMGVNVKVGGPCYSVGNFFKRNYQNLEQITRFMDATDYGLDFYSFHIYDYMRWSDEANDFVGSISSGLPEEGVFDALAAYYHNKTGKDFAFVGSEHGGYLTDSENRDYALNKLSEEFFPGSGFTHEMEKRSIDNFIMINSSIANTLMFMNHPHIVQKTVPFILLESSNWNPYYYSSLLVKENFDKNNPTFHEAKLIHFYEYFKDVRGRRIISDCSDTDIQHFGFVEDNTLVLLFHNQSNVNGEIDINVLDFQKDAQNIRIRRLGKGEDFRPYLSEENISNLDDKIAIGSQESIVLFVEYASVIPEEKAYDEQIYYSKETAVEFNGAKTFSVQTPDLRGADYAILRVGLSRESSLPKTVEIFLNGVRLEVEVEDSAERMTSDYYKTTKIIKVNADLLKAENQVEVRFPDGGRGGVGAVVLRVGSDLAVSTKKLFTEDIKFYPNPTNNLIHVEAKPNAIVTILDIDGKVMYMEKATSSLEKIDVSSLTNGIYILHIKDGESIVKGKFIITN